MASVAGDPVQCAQCHHAFAAAFAGQVSDEGVSLEAAAEPAVVAEAWRVDEVIDADQEDRYRRMSRTIRAARSESRRRVTESAFPTPEAADERRYRVDAATAPQANVRPRIDNAARAAAPAETSPASQVTAWIVALVGAVALGAGIGLLGWSLFGGRGELWTWGLALTLGGQGLMIVGLVQLLANLWSGSRQTSAKLVVLLQEMRRLQRTTETVAGKHAASPTSFYADLARGSSPQSLLANLKGQVDELATKLAAR